MGAGCRRAGLVHYYCPPLLCLRTKPVWKPFGISRRKSRYSNTGVSEAMSYLLLLLENKLVTRKKTQQLMKYGNWRKWKIKSNLTKVKFILCINFLLIKYKIYSICQCTASLMNYLAGKHDALVGCSRQGLDLNWHARVKPKRWWCQLLTNQNSDSVTDTLTFNNAHEWSITRKLCFKCHVKLPFWHLYLHSNLISVCPE